MVPVDLLDLMDHGGGVNPSLWMLEAARVVKVMEEGVRGRRGVWEKVRERLANEDDQGRVQGQKGEGEEEGEEEGDGTIKASPLAYLADSVDLLALTYHGVLVMLRDYGSQMISEGAVKDGRRIWEEMEGGGGGMKRKREEEQKEKEKTPEEREKEVRSFTTRVYLPQSFITLKNANVPNRLSSWTRPCRWSGQARPGSAAAC